MDPSAGIEPEYHHKNNKVLFAYFVMIIVENRTCMFLFAPTQGYDAYKFSDHKLFESTVHLIGLYCFPFVSGYV